MGVSLKLVVSQLIGGGVERPEGGCASLISCVLIDWGWSGET